MATTLTNLLAEVQTYEYASAVDADPITKWINSAYLDIANRHRWSWLEDVSTVTTVAGTATVALASTVDEVLRLRPGTSGPDAEDLVKLPPHSTAYDNPFRDEQSTVTGTPTHYIQYESTLHFAPVPDGAYVYVAYNRLHPVKLSSGSDTVLCPDDLAYAIVELAAAQAARRDRNFASADSHQQRGDELVRQAWMGETLNTPQNVTKVPMPGHYYGRYDR